jgi:hypothetical protein
MLFVVIERFRDHDAAVAVYERFRGKGRRLPDGLIYVDGWVQTNHSRCIPLMECDDVRLFEEWTGRWNDLVDFEIVAVHTSEEAAATTTCRGHWPHSAAILGGNDEIDSG